MRPGMAADDVSSLPEIADLLRSDKTRCANVVCAYKEIATPTEFFEEIADTLISAHSSVIESQEKRPRLVRRFRDIDGRHGIRAARFGDGRKMPQELVPLKIVAPRSRGGAAGRFGVAGRNYVVVIERNDAHFDRCLAFRFQLR